MIYIYIYIYIVITISPFYLYSVFLFYPFILESSLESVLETSSLLENRNRGEYILTRKLIFEIESALLCDVTR